MEKHRCKLCFRKFANGRALGGHMRSHMMNLPIPPKPKPPPITPSCEAPSSSTSSDSDPQTPDDCFHPRLPDHDYSSSLISSLQDRESENESFKNNNKTATIAATATAAATRRRRSKRIVTHKPTSFSSTYCSDYLHEKQHFKKCRRVVDDVVDDDDDDDDDDDGNVNYDMVERVSCTSEVTSDEDLAFCLMMMSRDSWSSSNKFIKHDDDDGDGNHDHDDGDNMVDDDDSSSHVMKKKYKCETCDKVFRSYQALGGHRASHKKQRLMTDNNINNNNNNNNNNNEVNQSYCNFDEKLIMEEDEFMLVQKKVHECPVCYRVFSSGQALGGHKRSHVLATTTTVNNNNNSIINGVEKTSSSSPAKKKKKMMMMVISTSSCHNNDSFIDLNLPAPIEDDDDEEISDDQIAVSAVSDNVHFC